MEGQHGVHSEVAGQPEIHSETQSLKKKGGGENKKKEMRERTRINEKG